MRTRLLVSCALLVAGMVVACSSPSDPVAVDMTGQGDVTGDTADVSGREDTLPYDVPTDTLLPDTLPTDVPADLADFVDAQTDAQPDLADTSPDQGDVVCLPVECALWCPFGFATDADGCPICACNGCTTDEECATYLTECINPQCGTNGECICDCSSTPDNMFECADGEEVPMCQCTPLGYSCMKDAHLQCAEFCKPGDEWMIPCGDLVIDQAWCVCYQPPCEPVCVADADSAQGWYNSCTGELITVDECAGCTAYCENPNESDEGWYNSCTDDLIQSGSCASYVDCVTGAVGCASDDCPLGQTTMFTCPDDSEVPMCQCTPKCAPECQNIGTGEEGIYNSCTGELVLKGACSQCAIECDLIGSKSEGWYSSCTGLLYWDTCSLGKWDCAYDVVSLCTGNTPCVGEGEFISNKGSMFGTCCPGLSLVKDQPSGPTAECDVDPQGEGWCVFCGDGICGDHEYLCNCPQDCPVVQQKGMGELCFSDAECAAGSTCIVADSQADAGICTRICTPGGDSDCDVDLVCASLPNFQAPGFCLQPCNPTAALCSDGLTCGADVLGADDTFTCWLWPQCDPVAQSGCESSQCHLIDGVTVCGPTGTASSGDECSASLLCAPGYTCGVGDRCWPTCETDEQCLALPDYYEFCLKKNGSKYGHCMVYL